MWPSTPVKTAAAPVSIAPDTFPHSIAMYLGSMCNEGGREVSFKARAHGIRFFFEEKAGVTVYRFEKGQAVGMSPIQIVVKDGRITTVQ